MFDEKTDSAIDRIEQDPGVKAFSTVAQTLVQKATDLEICDSATNEFGIGLLSQIAGGKRNAETQRKQFTEPLNNSLKAINAFFKNLTAPMDQADEIIRAKVLAYRRVEEARARKEAEELQAKMAADAKLLAEAGHTIEIAPPPIVAQAQPTTMTAKNGSATVRKVWDFAIADEKAVPRQYLAIDSQAIRQAIKDGIRDIPGVQIFQKESLAVR